MTHHVDVLKINIVRRRIETETGLASTVREMQYQPTYTQTYEIGD